MRRVIESDTRLYALLCNAVYKSKVLRPGEEAGRGERGGMGEVYRARDPRLGREVAIKVLPESVAADPASLARFEREAKAVAALSHPNILAIHELGHADGKVYAVMELLDGQTLGQRLAAGPLPQRKAIEIAREIALGLAAAHEKGIVHRDLKPGNLFLTRTAASRSSTSASPANPPHSRRDRIPDRDAADRARDPSWARSATCRPNRCGDWSLTTDPTSSPSGQSFTRFSRGKRPLWATRLSTR